MPAHLRAGTEAELPAARASIAAALREAIAVEGLTPVPASVTDPVKIAEALAEGNPDAGALAENVAASVAGLALSRAGAAAVWPDVAGNVFEYAAGLPDPLVFFEQSVVDGHPRHPLRRLRRGMSAADQVAYGPEHRPEVDLVWITVPREPIGSGQWGMPVADGLMMPLHPWQYARLSATMDLPKPLEGELHGQPLMSLRTFAIPWHPGIHVKTAVDVQMTGAVRTVSAASQHNGPTLSKLIQNDRDAPFRPMFELGAVGLRGPDGTALKSVSALYRMAPRYTDGRIALPLTSLIARTPHHRPFLADAVELSGLTPLEWWEKMLAVLIPEPLRQAALGLGLEAHGQNLLLVVGQGTPVGALYRDFGGVRAHTSFHPDVTLAGDVRTGDLGEVHRTLLGSLVATVLIGVADVLTATYDVPAEELWRAVANIIDGLQLPDVLREALYAETLPVKAYTAMLLAPDHLEPIWATVPNPLAAHR